MSEDKRFNHGVMIGNDDPYHYFKLRYTPSGLMLSIVDEDGDVIPGGNILMINNDGCLRLCDSISDHQNLIKRHPATRRIMMEHERRNIEPAKNDIPKSMHDAELESVDDITPGSVRFEAPEPTSDWPDRAINQARASRSEREAVVERILQQHRWPGPPELVEEHRRTWEQEMNHNPWFGSTSQATFTIESGDETPNTEDSDE